MDVQRPRGIIASAIILVIISALGIIGGIILVTTTLAMENTGLALSQGLLIWYTGQGYFDIGGVSYAMSASEHKDVISLLYGALAFVLIFSLLCLPASYGLFYMRKWGRYLAIIVGGLSIIAGIITLYYIVGLITLILGIVLLAYLSGDVKYEFQ
jgi:hypothetical protein